jgi:hypothetical protein
MNLPPRQYSFSPQNPFGKIDNDWIEQRQVD